MLPKAKDKCFVLDFIVKFEGQEARVLFERIEKEKKKWVSQKIHHYSYTGI